jgi:hydroxymethylpyrimidine/phosphomethylpyrimidine kinase
MTGNAGAAVDSRRPCVLVFAGLDPSGGAGLVADAQAVAAQGAHALVVCTALTVQDNDRVYGVQPVEADLVLRQARALTGKIAVDAVKIGIPGSAANAHAVAQVIRELRRDRPQLPVVLDPVLASGHGDLLTRGDAVAALAPLLPLVTVLTPNGPEARQLADADGAAHQAAMLHARGCAHVLITGGHDGGEHVVNRCFGPQPRQWRWPRLAGGFHGSGCTLAAAVAGQLALGLPTLAALENAQHYCYGALRGAYAIAPGQRLPLR